MLNKGQILFSYIFYKAYPSRAKMGSTKIYKWKEVRLYAILFLKIVLVNIYV
ncbi:hypothetical protein BTHERMOSOX_1145 [Bathymodiolus thermophilus thioautotrophic gill symbiont]|nr:hypothetical protein BTHERMOSOX_1145 [Bathymodiolus thermophilus thioautotrophic gill symbiont]